MAQLEQSPLIRLNIIDKADRQFRVSTMVGGTVTVSHLKRKIEAEFDELYAKELVVKMIEDEQGFTISNTSTVGEHFRSGDTVLFTQHNRLEKGAGLGMSLPSNLGEILSTVRFMTGSALDKLDRIDLSAYNVMEVVPEFLHLGFWYANEAVVAKAYKLCNKLFGEENIEKFASSCSEVQMGLLVRNLHFWVVDVPSAVFTHHEVLWELLQLLEKMSLNAKFAKAFRSPGARVLAVLQELAKDPNAPSEFKRISAKLLKNFKGQGTGMGKVKSAYVPSMLGSSGFDAYDLEQLLDALKTGSSDDRLAVLETIATSGSCEAVTEASVRYDYFEKLVMGLFAIRRLRGRKHITLFNLALSKVLANSSKEHLVQLMQKDILGRAHGFLLEAPVETHQACMELLGRVCRVAASGGMFNVEKSLELLGSPYPEFQALMSECLAEMSAQLPRVAALRFVPGMKDFIRTCLKTDNERVCANLLRTVSNLCLDEQCRYQLINLRGVETLAKFLETSSDPQVCQSCSKGLLNLAISSRENKARVLGAISNVLERFFQDGYDSVAQGYIETIMKSRNL